MCMLRADADAFILSGNKAAFKFVEMRPAQKFKLSTGGIETELRHYHVLPPKQEQPRQHAAQVQQQVGQAGHAAQLQEGRVELVGAGRAAAREERRHARRPAVPHEQRQALQQQQQQQVEQVQEHQRYEVEPPEDLYTTVVDDYFG